MREVAEALKRSFAPLMLGWVLTVWMPVPAPLRDALDTAVSAVLNGFKAAAVTVEPAQAQNGSARSQQRVQ